MMLESLTVTDLLEAVSSTSSRCHNDTLLLLLLLLHFLPLLLLPLLLLQPPAAAAAAAAVAVVTYCLSCITRRVLAIIMLNFVFVLIYRLVINTTCPQT